MINIRLMGDEQERQQAIARVQRSEGLKIISGPKFRANKRESGVRAYLDVEVVEDNAKKKQPTTLDEYLEKKARRLEFLIYADGDKIRTILNAANNFCWSIPTKEMDLDQFLNAVKLNLESIASILRLDVETTEMCDSGFSTTRRQSSYQIEHHLNLIHALVNRYPGVGECQALLALLGMYGTQAVPIDHKGWSIGIYLLTH